MPNILCALTLLLAAAAAHATTLRRMSLDELTANSGVVVRARCIASESRWEGGRIWTFTTFEVVETLKGSAPSTIRVRLIGGRAGSLTSRVEGVPRFRAAKRRMSFSRRRRRAIGQSPAGPSAHFASRAISARAAKP